MAVHLGESLLSAGFGGGDQLQGLLSLLVVLGQEFVGGQEHGAGQTRVGVRAALLHGQSAVAVGQGLGGAAESLFGPGCLGEWPGRLESDCGAMDVNFSGGFPLAAHGGVVQPGVMRGHLGGVVIEDSAHDLLRDVTVDQAGAHMWRHWCGVRCTGWPCSSRTSPAASQRSSAMR